jgi:hypothetical protein
MGKISCANRGINEEAIQRVKEKINIIQTEKVGRLTELIISCAGIAF